MTKQQPDFTIELRALPDDVPAVNRLRSALKVLLRRFRLHCVSVQFHDVGDKGSTAPGEAGGTDNSTGSPSL